MYKHTHLKVSRNQLESYRVEEIFSEAESDQAIPGFITMSVRERKTIKLKHTISSRQEPQISAVSRKSDVSCFLGLYFWFLSQDRENNH
jgi:hypothetical protein